MRPSFRGFRGWFLASKVDYTGSKYGHLTALKYVSTSKKTRAALWTFRCDCGNEKDIEARVVTAGSIKTCGTCHLKHKLKSSGAGLRWKQVASHNKLFKRFMEIAKRRELKWLLSIEEFMKLALAECTLCGTAPNTQQKGSRLLYNIVEPVHSQDGYAVGKCYSSCKACSNSFHKVGLSLIVERVATVFSHISRNSIKK